MREQNVFETLIGKKQQLFLATQVREAVTAGAVSFFSKIGLRHQQRPAGDTHLPVAAHCCCCLAQVCKMILKIDDIIQPSQYE
jgi:hypothetical protein